MCTMFDNPNQNISVFILFTRLNKNEKRETLTFTPLKITTWKAINVIIRS